MKVRTREQIYEVLKSENANKYLPSIKKMLEQDIKNLENGEKISVLATWLPSHCARGEKRTCYLKVREYLGMREQEYRKTLSKLREAYRLQNQKEE
ncbi:MAG TPA: hypothetical protein DCW90_02690 [Lachnospiraceae bacterium]|nr:hypothetical protein [Lachnospiraceae bacterium]